MKMKDIVDGEFPLILGRVCVKRATVEELILIRSEMKYEEEYRMTCRPMIKREGNELGEFYKGVLEKENTIMFSITRKEDGVLVAKVSFSDYNPRNRSIEVGYYVIPRFRKKGYMIEALWNICNVLFGKVKVNKIYAQTGSFNEESIKLLEKMNFKKDGVLRNHHELDGKFYDDYIYSVLSNEWEVHKRRVNL